MVIENPEITPEVSFQDLVNCPKCKKGHLKLVSDRYGLYKNCFICGFVREDNPITLQEIESLAAKHRNPSHGEINL